MAAASPAVASAPRRGGRDTADSPDPRAELLTTPLCPRPYREADEGAELAWWRGRAIELIPRSRPAPVSRPLAWEHPEPHPPRLSSMRRSPRPSMPAPFWPPPIGWATALPVLLGAASPPRSGAAEDPDEADGVPADLAKLPPLLHDERPADDREDREQEEDELRDGAGAQDELGDASIPACGSRHSKLLCGVAIRRVVLFR